jgi:diguanylate cyclase (GGDEF)-like protein
MHTDTATFSSPTWVITRWLAEPPAGTPDNIRQKLVAEMFGSLPVFFGGLVSTMLAPTVVVLIDSRPIFLIWFALELTVGISRLWLLVHSRRAAARGQPTPTNLHLVLALCWSACLGLGTFLALSSGNWVIATLVCIPAAAMVGGICFRNFAAPRLATVMMVLSIGPTGLGALLSGEPVLLTLVALVPMYLFSMTMAAFKLNEMLVSTMTAEQESGHRASHDDLTGLSNRANLTRLMDERLRGIDAGRAGFALFYLDLDGFKAVNDTRGHAAGDRVLQMVADRLNGLVRISDVTARLGGDEFVVLVDDITEEDAFAFGERLIAKIARSYDLGDGASCEIGVSIGIAGAPEHGRDARSLLAAADGALYAAKAMGKCRVAMAGPEAFGVAIDVPLVPEAGAPLRMPQLTRSST